MRPSPRAFACDRGGGAAIVFALSLPVLLGLAGAAVDYSVWVSQQADLQKAADAAAIGATKELSVFAATPQRVTSLAEGIVRANMSQAAAGRAVTVRAEILPERDGIRVDLSQPKQVFLSQLLSVTDDEVAATATARMAGAQKVCVIGLDPASGGTITLDASARITANDCGVFSNSREKEGVKATGGSRLAAQLICSSGGYGGGSSNFAGRRISDCPAQPDPLANRPPPPVGACKEATKLVVESDRMLTSGSYCGGIEIKGTARVTLSDGIYVIKGGSLKVDDTASLYGRNVSFYFADKDSFFDFLSRSTVNLGAPKDGPMAGILFYGNHDADDAREYKITSDNARTLLGTIYLPKGYFTIDANNPVADQSAYTAIIVRRLNLKAAPNLVLNANYAATDVPVPEKLLPGNSIRLSN